jgi:PAS domain S-box-containing protein
LNPPPDGLVHACGHPVAVLTLRDPRDAICRPSRQSAETSSRPGGSLCRGGDCRCNEHGRCNNHEVAAGAATEPDSGPAIREDRPAVPWQNRIIVRPTGHADIAAAASGGGLLLSRSPGAKLHTRTGRLRKAAAGRRASKDFLRRCEHHLRLVTDYTPIAIAHCDAQARLTFVNRRFREWYGLKSARVIGRPMPEAISDKAFAIMRPHIGECLAGKAVEFEAPDAADESRFLHYSFTPERKGGHVVGLIAAITNITGLKRAEERLYAGETAFRQLIQNAPFAVCVVDADNRIAQISAVAQKALAKAGPLIGRGLAEALRCIWPEPFVSNAIDHVRLTLATGEPCRSPSAVEPRSDDGTVESCDWTTERVTMPDGRFGVVCHFYDLAGRHKYEAELRESEATFRAMFDFSSVGKLEVELGAGRILRANAAMCRFVGYSEAELRGRTVFDITHPDDRDRTRELADRLSAGKSASFTLEKRYIRKDGTVVWGHTTVNVIPAEPGRPPCQISVIQDIDARKRAEQDLQTSKDRLQLALDAAQLGSFDFDRGRRVLSWDKRCKEIFGIAADEVPIEEIVKRVHPDDVEMVRTFIKTPLHAPEKPDAFEHRFLRGGEIRWVEVHRLAYFVDAGQGLHAEHDVGTIQDITERKEREEKEQFLMREVNHRAKNMLSVVEAIAHQTAARSPEDFIACFSDRIQALSASQDLLVRNEWKGVDMEDLVCAQIAHFADLVSSRIAMHGPRLRLQPASAQAIGLALHELATNAGKYGALSTDRGNVDINWGIDDDTLTMSWTESAGPPVSEPRRRGFGTIVTKAMTERSVGGKVDLEYEPSGVTWRLTCPAANALERTVAAAGERTSPAPSGMMREEGQKD